MRSPLLLIKTIAVCFVMTACTSYESARTTHQAREYLTEDIEEMIVFNLIRAANGLPFAHYDVSTVQSAVSMKATGKATGGRTGANNGFRPDTVVTSSVRTITRALGGEVGGERNNSVTVTVAPVFDEPKIYAQYVTFLNSSDKGLGDMDRIESGFSNGATVETEKDPEMKPVTEKTTETTVRDKAGNLVGTTSEVETTKEPAKPPQVEAGINFAKIYSLRRRGTKPKSGFLPHTVRQWDDGFWYYVPIDYKPEFSKLCLSLVARGGGASSSGGGKKDRSTKALEQLNTELMRQNTILDR